MKVILAGGGTAGSVVPLLAVYAELKKQKPETTCLFIGTRRGEPEIKLLAGSGIPFRSIYGGKLRRYFDIRNITDVFLTLVGFIQSLWIIFRFQADIIIGAGGFISVPVIWAGWVLQKKILIHQQDIRPSLSNILVIALTHRITVAFERSLRNFPPAKTVWTGNPVRNDIWQGSRERALERFKLQPGVPLLLVVGGGTGALSLNTIANQALPELLTFCQVIHCTGVGKRVTGLASARYRQYEFLGEAMPDVLAAADLVISRAGLSALTEYAALGKPAILVPLPHSHQKENAEHFAEKGAAVLIDQENLSPGILASKVRALLNDAAALGLLSNNVRKIMKPNATTLIVAEMLKLVGV